MKTNMKRATVRYILAPLQCHARLFVLWEHRTLATEPWTMIPSSPIARAGPCCPPAPVRPDTLRCPQQPSTERNDSKNDLKMVLTLRQNDSILPQCVSYLDTFSGIFYLMYDGNNLENV